MSFRQQDDDTICAVATPTGLGGIAVLRVSGPQALANVRKLCQFLPDHPQSHRLYYGLARSLSDGEPVDEVLVSFFAQGKSFTGEQTLEISCHGSPQLAKAICQELVVAGCRMAEAGEFTYRAFMSGRIDLVQAEGVLALIESESRPAAKLALNQLRGSLSARLSEIERDLTWCLAQIEAEIDFSGESLETAGQQAVALKTERCLAQIEDLSRTYRSGRVLREGLQVAIVGAPNVGKSSLFNRLLGHERAIVSEVAGTTRDTISDEIEHGGLALRLVDTAGVRETLDKVERMGIARSREARQAADLVILVFDVGQLEIAHQQSLAMADASESESEACAETLYVLNKIDFFSDEGSRRRVVEVALAGLNAKPEQAFCVSCVSGEGIEELKAELNSRLIPINVDQGAIVTNARHFEQLGLVRAALERALALLRREESPEFSAFELQLALKGVHHIFGKQVDEAVLDRVFKEFCIGK